MSYIGSKIKQIRETKGYSQEVLAYELGVSQATIHYIESGKSKPNFETITKIANFFDMELDEFIEEKYQNLIVNDSAIGYQAVTQNFYSDSQLIKQIEDRLSYKDKQLKELHKKIQELENKLKNP